MLINRAAVLLTLSLALGLTGCAVGPNYHLPKIALPQSWLSAPPKQIDEQAVANREWWNNFHDPVLTLLVDRAVANSPDIKIYTARIAQARASRAQTRAGLFPSVTANGSATREANQLAFPGGAPGGLNLKKPFDIFQTGFDASWEIDLFGGTRRAVEEATANLEAAQAAADAATISLLAEVARTYIEVRHDQAQLAIIDDTVKSDQHTLNLTREMAKAGTVAHVDATRADAELQQAASQAAVYQNELAQAEFSLDVLIGAQPGTAQTMISGNGPIPMANETVILAAPAQVIANRPDLRAAERTLAAATAQEGVATAAMLPRVSLSGLLGLLNISAAHLLEAGSQSWEENASIMQPVFDFGKLRAGLDLAKGQQQEALATYEKTVITALSDVEGSLTAYTHEQAHRDALRRVVADDQKAVAVARERYRHGTAAFLDALDADRTLYAAQSDLSASEALVSEDLVALYKSLGGGWQDSAASTAPKMCK